MENHHVFTQNLHRQEDRHGVNEDMAAGLRLVLSRELKRGLRNLADTYLVNQKDSMNFQNKKFIVRHDQILTMNIRVPLPVCQEDMNQDICIYF